MQLKNQYGKVVMEIESVKVQGEVIVIKAEALGSMPINVHVTADNLWETRQYLTWPVVRKLPVLFFRGRRAARRAARQGLEGQQGREEQAA